MLLTSDYDYSLPDDLIASHPLARREDSRMMVLHRAEQRIEHRFFREFPGFLRAGDLVVLNDTRVIPARVFADGGKIELLFLETVREDTWKCLVKPGRKMRLGATVQIRGVTGTVEEILPDGERIIAFTGPVDLDAAGELPLPPYFARAVEPADSERYQTVFARERGAVAAPTAGLHFTPEILAQVPHTFVTLHVGVGTFRPVQVDDLTQHRMHSERFRISEESARAINAAQRLVAIGTTTARVLESQGLPVSACESSTDIFIYPPYQPRAVGALLTNFHLPKSTLLMLVSALAGREFVLRAYAEAIAQRYRFYSYGDCMLIL
ncbi:S-adenosylmethionine/tRNA-ribosyltransferase-isomerase [Chthoniobacter flavus Ellin428]|uniref:S-adenosylmethionine:tRNA ribosyltransferase-isomerase n=1 Tax=Chthoniobacter flavus Ellin428 TaxID=497964 RepID=B4DBL0_9BACT|nr:tRNA preQ1(34) S-adenosylmethionine ribosyltransferase-isomerase QueA [Chthoniobacter flavus]EDY16197.1 S-adenosylmethionine/tRNA-ribosyltransferase-isomerase [Chthoniobacter flavus Ellin428]TCO87197.1 S-adenosylmethionine--tRNA ribosyltransferase-isomerase [Chthoniobacter flavus]